MNQSNCELHHFRHVCYLRITW